MSRALSPSAWQPSAATRLGARGLEVQLAVTLATTGNPLSLHASIPPANGLTLPIPSLFILSATRALEISLGQEQ